MDWSSTTKSVFIVYRMKAALVTDPACFVADTTFVLRNVRRFGAWTIVGEARKRCVVVFFIAGVNSEEMVDWGRKEDDSDEEEDSLFSSREVSLAMKSSSLDFDGGGESRGEEGGEGEGDAIDFLGGGRGGGVGTGGGGFDFDLDFGCSTTTKGSGSPLTSAKVFSAAERKDSFMIATTSLPEKTGVV